MSRFKLGELFKRRRDKNVPHTDPFYIIWSPAGESNPAKQYHSLGLAVAHAQDLTKLTGKTFYVLKSRFGFKPGEGEAPMEDIQFAKYSAGKEPAANE